MNQKKFVIIDSNALLHRAWHAIPNLSTSSGEMVNAVYGWLLLFFKMCSELKPDYIAATFDVKGPTFRNDMYSEYKAQRKKQPDELYAQIPIIKDFLRSFNIPIYELEGYEADDIIGTICKENAVNVDDILTIIMTGDKDTFQLIDSNTQVYTLKRGMTDTTIYDTNAVINRFGGITPQNLVDYKALRGDPSDNIPGVKGVGEKTAIHLISEFNSLDYLYSQLEFDENILIEKGVKKRIVGLLKEYKEQAYLSKDLSIIKTDVPVKFDLKETKTRPYDRSHILDLLKKYEFKTLLNRLPDFGEKEDVKEESSPQGNLFDQPKNSEKTEIDDSIIYNDTYYLINTDEDFQNFLEKIKEYKAFAFDTETKGLDIYNDDLLGISICGENGVAYYIPYNKEYYVELQKIFRDENILKYAHNGKFDIHILSRYGFEINGFKFDSMIASYLLNPGSRGHGLDTLVFNLIGHEMVPITKLIGKKGKNQLTLDQCKLEDVSQYACEDADYTFQLVSILKERLREENQLELFETIEMPLIPVLVKMEQNGFLLDSEFLSNLSKKVTAELEDVDTKIFEFSERDFNINSPKQLKEILFDELGISSDGLKKTKTGISTAAGELEKIIDEHPIIELIIKHRELSKLLSTYIDALPKLVDKSGRVHSSFNQTITTTGRLSSSDPNLQNIPIRTKLGAEIRKAFIAKPGYKIIAIDYSQIELRLIAGLAHDENMMKAFVSGEDIHKHTASLVFDIPLEEVTKEQRYQAKAINFGVIYGLGAFGLAKNIGITNKEAREFIDNYFSVYSGVKQYLDNTKTFAKENEYVETHFGRKRYFYNINSGVSMVRAAEERMAINAPIQGTASDLIKLAMIKSQLLIEEDYPKSSMILQVHDELVFEVPDGQVQEFSKKCKHLMENLFEFNVPIIANVEVGDNWGDLKEVN